MSSASGNRRGCWFAISRCFNSQKPGERNLYSKVSSENIEFEDLVTADKRALELSRKRQVVTDTEREHVMNGNLEELVEQQRRLDEERDVQMRRREEALRREEEAYYAAKREAANRRPRQPRGPVTLEIEQSDQSDVTFSFPTLHPPLIPTSVPMATESSSTSLSRGMADRTRGHMPVGLVPVSGSILTDSQAKDDDDFDQFLESVKVKQLSLTKKSDPLPELPVVVGISDDEEEIDFGFWEKAPDPASRKKILTTSSDKSIHQQRETDVQEADLGLL